MTWKRSRTRLLRSQLEACDKCMQTYCEPARDGQRQSTRWPITDNTPWLVYLMRRCLLSDAPSINRAEKLQTHAFWRKERYHEPDVLKVHTNAWRWRNFNYFIIYFYYICSQIYRIAIFFYFFLKPIVYFVCKIVELSNKCSGLIITMFFFELWWATDTLSPQQAKKTLTSHHDYKINE